MNNLDEHLGTGVYDPGKYWSARARDSKNNYLRAVSTFTGTDMENRSMDRVQRNFFKLALKEARAASKDVMEYGCGAGRWRRLFPARQWRWHGVDISDDMLRIAAQRFPDVMFDRVQNGCRIPFPDSSFDLVYSITVLHHNHYDQQERILSEISRVLKHDGTIILLEDLGGHHSFNMYARTRDAWLELAERHLLDIIWYREISYWILRDQKYFRNILAKPVFWRLWRRLIGPLDYLFDPYLQTWFNIKNHIAAIMVFKKREAM